MDKGLKPLVPNVEARRAVLYLNSGAFSINVFTSLTIA